MSQNLTIGDDGTDASDEPCSFPRAQNNDKNSRSDPADATPTL